MTTGSWRSSPSWRRRPGCRPSSPTRCTTPTAGGHRLQDVLVCIRHGATLDEARELLPPQRRVPAEERGRAGGHRRRPARRPRPAGLGRRDGAGGGHRPGLPAGPELRALSVPGLHGPRGRDAVLISLPACPRGLTRPLSAHYQAVGEAAGARAGDHRAHQPGRVLPDRVGPDGVRAEERDHRPGAGECRRLDRGLLPGHHQGRPDRPQAPLRALHQRGADAAGHRHRLRRQPARGGDPVPLHTATARTTRPWSAP